VGCSSCCESMLERKACRRELLHNNLGKMLSASMLAPHGITGACSIIAAYAC
jgi:hypothetical protein